MRSIWIGFALATVALGQTVAQVERRLEIKNAPTDQAFMEMANGIRTLMEIRDLSANAAQRAITMHATADQVAGAEWLAQQLDQPIGNAGSSSDQFKMDEAGPKGQPIQDVVRVFNFKNPANVQEFVEIANGIRTVTETRRLFTYNANMAMMIRDTPDKAAAIEWLVGQLDKPANQPKDSDGGGYSGLTDKLGDTPTRVFYIKTAKNPQELINIANAVRSTAQIRRLFTVNAQRAIILRDYPDTVATVEWLLNQLDQPPAQTPSSEEYRIPGATDESVRVFHLASADLLQQFKSGAAEAIGSGGIFVFDTPRVVMLRGNTSQLAVATQLINDLQAQH